MTHLKTHTKNYKSNMYYTNTLTPLHSRIKKNEYLNKITCIFKENQQQQPYIDNNSKHIRQTLNMFLEKRTKI